MPTSKANAFDYRQTLRAQLRGGYAQLTDGDGSALFIGNLLYVPHLKLSDKDSVTSLTSFSMNTQQRSLEEDVFFAQSANAVVRPSWRRTFNENLDGKLRVSFLQSANKENNSDSWLDNVYDYHELAFGGQATLKTSLTGRTLPVKLGLEWLTRAYPNFAELISVDGVNNIKTKDYNGVRWSLDTGMQVGSLGFGLRYVGVHKGFGDSYVVPFTGDYGEDYGDDKKRSDTYNRLSLDLAYQLVGDWALGLSLGAIFNSSNQGLFDIYDNIHLPEYYNYNVSEASISASWLPFGGRAGHEVTLGYEISSVNYPGRKVRWADGTYTESAQADVMHTISYNGRWALNRTWALTALGDYKMARSNQAYEATSLSEYTVFSAFGGIEFRL